MRNCGSRIADCGLAAGLGCLLLLLLLLSLPAQAVAGDCRVGVTHGHGGYSGGYGYRHDYHADQFVVLYRAGSELRDKALIEEATAQLKAELAGLKAAIQARARFTGEATIRFEGEAETSVSAAGGAADNADNADRPPPEGGTSPGGALADKVQAIVTRSCLRCHNGTDQRTDFELTDLAAVRYYAGLDMWARTHSGSKEAPLMPLGGEALPDDEVKLLREWADSLPK